MGEYATHNGNEIKIGTCEWMYYLRYEDRYKVQWLPNSLNAATELDLYWRLPFPDEDDVPIGHYESYRRGLRLWKKSEPGGVFQADFTEDSTTEDPGSFQLRHESGLLVSVNCYHGARLPAASDEVRPCWNGKSWSLELCGVKNDSKRGVVPLVNCRWCGQMWSYKWDEVMPYVNDKALKARLEVHASPKPEPVAVS